MFISLYSYTYIEYTLFLESQFELTGHKKSYVFLNDEGNHFFDSKNITSSEIAKRIKEIKDFLKTKSSFLNRIVLIYKVIFCPDRFVFIYD